MGCLFFFFFLSVFLFHGCADGGVFSCLVMVGFTTSERKRAEIKS